MGTVPQPIVHQGIEYDYRKSRSGQAPSGTSNELRMLCQRQSVTSSLIQVSQASCEQAREPVRSFAQYALPSLLAEFLASHFAGRTIAELPRHPTTSETATTWRVYGK